MADAEWDEQEEEQKVEEDEPVVAPAVPSKPESEPAPETKFVTEIHASSPDLEVAHSKPELIATSAPGEAPAGASFATLHFNTENNGELFMRWSETFPSGKGPLAVFWTTHKISAFKFKKPLELMRNIGGNRKKFYEGLASFVKEADANEGHITVLDASDTGFGDVWVSVGGKKWGKEAGVPRKIALRETVDVNGIEALVIIPRACAVFEGILKIDLMKFVNTGLREGAAWQRH